MSGIGVVVNPYARSNLGRPDRVERLGRILGDDGVVVQTNGLPHLDEVAGRFHERAIDILAVCGGDGTIFRTVTALRRVYGDDPLPLLLPLRAGTINVIAGSIRCMHGSPERVLAHVLHDFRRGHIHDTVERDLISVDGREYGFLFGLGVVVNFLRLYYTSPKPSPLRAAGLVTAVAASAVFGTSLARAALHPFSADVDCDGERLPFRRFTLCLAMTIESLPLGFRPGYLATRKHGYFHLLAGPISGPTIVRNLHRFRRGLPVRDESLYDNLAREVRIEFDEPSHYMIDADILGPVKSLRLTAGPRVRLIRG
jgi:diacylglycerol kinase family enzyme